MDRRNKPQSEGKLWTALPEREATASSILARRNIEHSGHSVRRNSWLECDRLKSRIVSALLKALLAHCRATFEHGCHWGSREWEKNLAAAKWLALRSKRELRGRSLTRRSFWWSTNGARRRSEWDRASRKPRDKIENSKAKYDSWICFIQNISVLWISKEINRKGNFNSAVLEERSSTEKPGGDAG